ncbi:fungal-specific transcription factor domain-containing protein [Rhexocercosporidium sp. MPI-PUGE-AT-0058]|nr:fungal-specific transcription factor domain-containing protein [Rhexocercosporidium sp. MPI-PUGE-AT-0058]
MSAVTDLGLGSHGGFSERSPDSDPSEPKKEPNPNRQKSRISRGCDECKAKHTKCNGQLPCEKCVKYSRICKYEAPYTRGKKPPIVAAISSYDPSNGISETEHFTPGSNFSSSRESARREQVWHQHQTIFGTAIAEEDYSNDTRPRKIARMTEEESQYNKLRFPSDHVHLNGETIFQRTQNNLNHRANYHQNPIFSFGDPPIPDLDTSFFALPTYRLAQSMITQYFDFGAALHRFLHHKTVEEWMESLLDSPRSMNSRPVDHSKNAVVLMIFALAYESSSTKSEEGDGDMSFHYFQVAEAQLEKERGGIQLPTIQARLLQCIYLCSRSRIHQCWSIFTVTVGLIFAMGLQRQNRLSETGDMIEVECQKRAFWFAYTMDKHLSSSLGRPTMIRHEDIDQDLPRIVEDEDLSKTGLVTMSDGVQSSMKATIFSIKLAQILDEILHTLYSIRKPSIDEKLHSARNLRGRLQMWRADINDFFELDPATLEPLFAAQYIGLQLAYAHARVLLHRPFLLQDMDCDAFRSSNGYKLRQECDFNTTECVKAAMDIVKTIDGLYQREKNFGASWFSHYCGFCAVVVLYVRVIKLQSEPAYNWISLFEAGATCQSQIKIAGEKESFANRCSEVLQELRFEAQGHMQKAGNRPETRQGSIDTDGSGLPQQDQGTASHFGGKWDDMNFDQSAPGGGILNSLFNTVEGINVRNASGSLVDRIDRWGFSSLTGY